MSRRAGLVALAVGATLTGCAPVEDQRSEDGLIRLGETGYVDGPKVTPLTVIEDSRCPQDVDCVWPGRVLLSVRIDGGRTSVTRTLENGRAEPIFDGTVTLEAVLPVRVRDKVIAPSDYRFRFRFAGGI